VKDLKMQTRSVEAKRTKRQEERRSFKGGRF
jgi:hypothetical protein